MPNGWRHPKLPPCTSCSNAAAAHAAASARPTAAGASNNPVSGIRKGRLPRWPSTASTSGTTAKAPARAAQVSRHPRARKGAASTGSHSATARMPNVSPPIPNRSTWVTFCDATAARGEPTNSSQPLLRRSEANQGRFSARANNPATMPAAAKAAAVRHELRANRVARASAIPTMATIAANVGAKADTTAVSKASWAMQRISSRRSGVEKASATSESARAVRAGSTRAIKRKRCTTQGIAPYAATTPQRPAANALYGSGTAANTTRPTMRARDDGKMDIARQAP